MDEEPDAANLWLLLLAAGAPWGRFPSHPKILKSRVSPMVDKFTGDGLMAQVAILIDRGFLVEYVCPKTGKQCLCIPNFSRFNDGHQWHRLGEPEFGPPPNWQPPEGLLKYMETVAAGRFQGKTLRDECAKFGVNPTPHSQGPTPKDPLPRTHSQGTPPTEALAEALALTEVTSKASEESLPSASADGPSDEEPLEVIHNGDPASRKKLTPQQQVLQAAWTACGLANTPGDHENLTKTGKPNTRGFSGLVKLVQEHGVPLVEEWATHMQANGQGSPAGAKAWPWFQKVFRAAMNRPWEWQEKDGVRKGFRSTVSPRDEFKTGVSKL